MPEPAARVLVLCPYPQRAAAGQRFRVEQYLEHLAANGYVVSVQPFLDADVMKVLYEPGHLFRKFCGVLRGFLARLRLLLSVRSYDYVYLYREATPLGPPVIEVALFALKCRVIYDFDDAIFIGNTSFANRQTGLFKWPSKTSYITKRSWRVSVSTPFLYEWAKRLNPTTVMIPTVVDLNYHRPAVRSSWKSRRPTVGWTGSRSTAKYLELVRPALLQLQQRYEFEFLVICDIDPGFDELRNYRFTPWRLESEMEDLRSIDIGLMPLADGDWELGKAGFKAIQYSAVEAVPVVSSVGVASDIVVDGMTGYVVQNSEEAWVQAIGRLLDDQGLVSVMGKRGREHVARKYSVASQLATYLSLFSGEPPRRRICQ